MKKRTVHVITHTHWDREWHKTFEEFRIILVDLIDEILLLLESNPQYTCFHLDGQTIVLEDYLEMRPENSERIKRLIEQRRLYVGPWYVLPDEFLVSGESIIRNLLLGDKIASEFGRAMKIGYIPDSFGHISQLPQIFAGFGIYNIILWRGFGGEPGQESSEYIWHSPDDTQAVMIHLPEGGYARDFIATDDPSAINELMQSIYDKLQNRTSTPHLLMLQGSDHLWPNPKLTEIIEFLNNNFPDEFVLDSLENYVAAIKQYQQDFQRVYGEHRFGYRFAFLLQGVYSARMYLKQANERCQTLLERYAEPLNAIAVIQKFKSNKLFLDHAWKYLLQNHPHDSICGCSIDAVHRENMTRFEKSEQISRTVIQNAMQRLVSKDKNALDSIFLNIFNPSPYTRSEVLECTVQFPYSTDDGKFQKPPTFRILGSDNQVVPCQIVNSEPGYQLTYFKHDYLKQLPVLNYRILIDAKNLPGCGICSLKIQQSETEKTVKTDLICGRFFMENKYLRVDIAENGVVKILDKERQIVYDRLNIFEDSADIGDEYNYSYPENDERFLSHKFKPRISIIENGSLRAAIRIRLRMKLPQSFDPNRNGRSTKTTVLKVSSIVRVDHNSPLVHFETNVQNNVKDHRFRVLFKTDVQSNKSHAESAFHIIKRDHRTYDPQDFANEIPAATHPLQRFVSVADRDRGLTLLSQGIPEYEFMPQYQGTLALTLLRCVNRLSGDDLVTRPLGPAGPIIETPEAQCLGNYTFRYAILPHQPDLQQANAFIHDHVVKHQLQLFVFQSFGSRLTNGEKAYLEIEPRTLRLSAFKQAESGHALIVRIYNPGVETVTGKIRFNFNNKTVSTAGLNEQPIEELSTMKKGDNYRIAVNPWQILTLRVEL